MDIPLSHPAPRQKLRFGGHCLREVFQTLRGYNFAGVCQFIPGLMTLTLFQGHRYVRIMAANCLYILVHSCLMMTGCYKHNKYV